MKDPYNAPAGYLVAPTDVHGEQYNWTSYTTWNGVLDLFDLPEHRDTFRILAKAEWSPTPFWDGSAGLQPFRIYYQRKWTPDELFDYAARLAGQVNETSVVYTKAQRKRLALNAEIAWQKALQGDEESSWNWGGIIYACRKEYGKD